MTPKGNHTPCNNPPNLVPKLPADLDADENSSDYSLLDTSDSSDDKYYQIIRCAKNNKKKRQSKTYSDHLIKKCANITAKLLTFMYISKVIKLKMNEYSLHYRVYFLYFMNSLKTNDHN